MDDGRDPELHVRAARAAEEEGDLDRALVEWNRAAAAAARPGPILGRIAELRVDRGEPDRALRCLRRWLELEPASAEARGRLAGLLAEHGQAGLARDTLDAGAAEASDARAAVDDALREPDTRPDPPAADPTRADALALALLEAFAGREGVYARQWTSPTGRSGYTPVHAAFDLSVARRHLAGEETVGIYPLRSDASVRWALLDLDLSASALREAKGPRALEPLRRRAHAVACRLLDASASLGLHPLLADSGYKGRHLWFLFDRWVPASAARRLLERVLAEAGPLPHEVVVERFPRQSRLPRDGGLGNLAKLPLGVHRRTGRWCRFLEVSGRPVEDALRVLTEAPRVEAGALSRLLGASGPSTAAGASTGSGLEPERVVEPPSLEPPYALDADPEVQALRAGCPVLDAALTEALATRVVGPEARTVITHTLGHLSRGADAVNAVLAPALDVDDGLLLKSRLAGHPTSCPKIRRRLPVLALRVGCDCHFGDTASYPHPLLHVERARVRPLAAPAERGPGRGPERLAEPEVPAGPVSPAANSDRARGHQDPSLDRLAREWLEARAELDALSLRMERLEVELAGRLEEGAGLTVAGRTVIRRGAGLELEDAAIG